MFRQFGMTDFFKRIGQKRSFTKRLLLDHDSMSPAGCQDSFNGEYQDCVPNIKA